MASILFQPKTGVLGMQYTFCRLSFPLFNHVHGTFLNRSHWLLQQLCKSCYFISAGPCWPRSAKLRTVCSYTCGGSSSFYCWPQAVFLCKANCLFAKPSVFCLPRFASTLPDSPTRIAGYVNKKFLKELRSSSDIRRLAALAKPEADKIGASVLLLFFSSGVSMAVPFCIGKLIDIIYSSSSSFEQMMISLKTVSLTLSIVFLFGAAANACRVYLMQISGQRITNRLRHNIFSSILQQETAFFDKSPTGELINRLSSDTTLVGKAVTDNISDGLRSSAQAIAGVSLMFYVCPKLAGIALSIVPPVVLFAILYGRYVRKITKAVQDSLADANQVAEERVSNIRTVRAFAQESREIDRYGNSLRSVLELTKKEAVAKAIFFGLTGLSGNLIMLTVLYSGGSLMTDAQITVGDLTSFLLYAVYVGVSIAGLSSFYSELMKGIGASSRLFGLADRMPQINSSGGLVPSIPLEDKSIVFDNVHFAYPTREDTMVLNGVDLKVQSGSVTAVVGASGSGKSTLGALLLRFYDPGWGRVLIGGHDVKILDPNWLRSHIGTVSQEPVLFSGTLFENIAYSVKDLSTVSVEEVLDAATKANASHFIKNFPSGLDTMVGERGQMLSGGQRQRIAIARAIFKDPEILLLDEATSALDAESEHLVQDALQKLMVGRTTIIIAHRLSTIKAADQVAVLDQGRIAEIGSYHELILRKDGIFRRLVEKQAALTER